MSNELPFDGFAELIAKPLEEKDPVSFNRVKTLLLDLPTKITNPISLLIQRYTGKVLDERESRMNWRALLNHKLDMEAKLGRRVSIQVSAIDYFDMLGTGHTNLLINRDGSLNSVTAPQDEWLGRVYAPNLHLEKLKEEMLRSKRYKNALSVIMLDIDEFRKINEQFSFKTGDEILSKVVKIVKKTIRSVDILARYSGDRFLLILPNTNKRETIDLGQRLCQSVAKQTQQIPGLGSGVTVTLSIGQVAATDSAKDFMKRLENALEVGKKQKRSTVYSI